MSVLPSPPLSSAHHLFIRHLTFHVTAHVSQKTFKTKSSCHPRLHFSLCQMETLQLRSLCLSFLNFL